ncbi:hypothetical protein K2Z83_11140 [Oscillochloris sp. ZM17-4]|uniref:hypothetical protein n=1 Tax=Oscillochloris sp. ZM17-4 TaxID=2866714 RepID=UPI001C73D1B2|nr:hypothetical protein [Oscillochloris sp. ZM17-4]MBX0328231.1 hypothetical protein [Oscillochloris sp. ZM17-4]
MSQPSYYIPIPRRLIIDLRDAPVAIGAYALIARRYHADRVPVPISPRDLQIYDPSLSYGAATRALQRLAAAGWLIAQRTPGRKSAYISAWGRIAGAPRAWDLELPDYGRPRHIPTLRLDRRLLDICMGRLDPHPGHPALAQRYLTTPLLSLRDIGIYSMALHGFPAASYALENLGLLRDDAAQPLPDDDATILALASQRRLLDAGSPIALSPAGYRQLGLDLAEPPAPASTGQALFFVPPDQIGPMIGNPIIHEAIIAQPSSAPRRRGRDRYVLGTTSPRASGGQWSIWPRQICAMGSVATS